MKRKFTEDQMEKLSKAHKNGEEIVIEGVNAVGEHFVTRGRITTTDRDKIGVNEGRDYKTGDIYDIIYLEFGQEKDAPSRKQTLWFAPFKLNIEMGEYAECLTIQRVLDKDGNVIFEQKNFDEIERMCRDNYKLKDKRSRSERLNIRYYDPISKICKRNLIGKPVYVVNNETQTGNCGIVCGVDSTTYSGEPIISILDGPGSTCIFPSHNQTLMFPENDGGFVVLYEGKEDERELFRSIFRKNIDENENTEE